MNSSLNDGATGAPREEFGSRYIRTVQRLSKLKRYRKTKHIRRAYKHLLERMRGLNLCGLYHEFLRRGELRLATPLRLVPTSDYAARGHSKVTRVAPEQHSEICGPEFVGVYPVKLHSMPLLISTMPKLEIVELHAVTVVAGTNLILTQYEAIHPAPLVPCRDLLPIESFGFARINPDKNSIKIIPSRSAKRIEQGISLLGQCTGNYAHWLTETLPKLIIINEYPQFDGLPLIVDGWTHPVIRDTIRLLDGKRREIILLDRWEGLHVSNLVDISATAYIPPAILGFKIGIPIPVPDPLHYVFSQFALRKLRVCACAASRSDKNLGKKLYLRRERATTGNDRFVKNAEAVEAVVREYGFEPIDPARFNFEEQIAIFSSAEYIVSPIGAALANAIFSSPGCQIIVLSGYCENGDYYYFSNLMNLLGHRMRYVLGQQENNTEDIAQRDYTTDLRALREALIGILQREDTGAAQLANARTTLICH